MLIEYAKQSGRPFRVFALDTGRLHPETYRFFELVGQHYQLRIEYCFPQAEAVQDLVRKKGLFSFYQDGHQECCGIRKVEPLRRQLAELQAWITGQRKDQSPTRQQLDLVQIDPTFTGRDDQPLVKWNPLAETTGHVFSEKGRNPWQQDGLELRVDSRLAARSDLGRGGEERRDFLLLGLSPTPGPELVYGLANRHGSNQPLPNGVDARCVFQDGGYVGEVRIDATLLDRWAGRSWRSARINLLVNDLDRADGSVRKWAWRPDWRAENNIVGSGTLVRSTE